MKKPLNGIVIIKIKQKMNNQTESGLYKDTTYDVQGKMAICAEVVSVSERGSNEIMLEVDKGMPRSKEIDSVYVRNHDVKHTVEVGDRIYFHYLTLQDPQNEIDFRDGYWYYKLALQDVFLAMRNDSRGKYVNKGELTTPHLQNQYVLGESYWGKGWEEIDVDGVTVGGKVGFLGMITETKSKHVEDYARITDIGVGIKPYSRHGEVSAGDVVLINSKCEFVNEIDGKDRWVFTHQDILGILNADDTISPVCDGVLIKLKDRTYEGNLEVEVTKLPLINEGVVVSVGKKVSDTIEIGATVKFQPKRSRVIDSTYAIVPEGNIYGVLCYSV